MSALLGGQGVKLALYAKAGSMYGDVSLGSVPIVNTKLCAPGVGMLTAEGYQGMVGDIGVLDTSGQNMAPTYQGLGSQFCCAYLNGT